MPEVRIMCELKFFCTIVGVFPSYCSGHFSQLLLCTVLRKCMSKFSLHYTVILLPIVLNRLLCDTGNWSNLCVVLCHYQGDLLQLSSEAVSGAMNNAWRKAEWVEGIVKLLLSLAQKGTVDIHPEVGCVEGLFRD